MCIKIVERYAVCRCIYTTHAVDPCSRVGHRDHTVISKEVLVGYTCPRHSATAGDTPNNAEGNTAADEPRRRRRMFWWGKNRTTSSEETGTEERLGYAHRLWAYAQWLWDRTWRALTRRWTSVFRAPAASPET